MTVCNNDDDDDNKPHKKKDTKRSEKKGKPKKTKTSPTRTNVARSSQRKAPDRDDTNSVCSYEAVDAEALLESGLMSEYDVNVLGLMQYYARKRGTNIKEACAWLGIRDPREMTEV